jgi:hypothetical protein
MIIDPKDISEENKQEILSNLNLKDWRDVFVKVCIDNGSKMYFSEYNSTLQGIIK